MFHLSVGGAPESQNRVFPPKKTGGVFMKRAFYLILTAILVLLLLPAGASGEEGGGSSQRDILVYANIAGGSGSQTQDPGTPSGSGSGGPSKTDPPNTENPPSDGDPSRNGDPVYSVELTWGSMIFEYNRGSAEPWSVSKGPYGNGLAPNEIKVENCSTAAVRYRTSFVPAKAEYALIGTLTAKNSNGEPVPCQDYYAYLENPNLGDSSKKRFINHVFLSISGTLPSDLPTGVVEVGKVTVEIVPDAGL